MNYYKPKDKRTHIIYYRDKGIDRMVGGLYMSSTKKKPYMIIYNSHIWEIIGKTLNFKPVNNRKYNKKEDNVYTVDSTII